MSARNNYYKVGARLFILLGPLASDSGQAPLLGDMTDTCRRIRNLVCLAAKKQCYKQGDSRNRVYAEFILSCRAFSLWRTESWKVQLFVRRFKRLQQSWLEMWSEGELPWG